MKKLKILKFKCKSIVIQKLTHRGMALHIWASILNVLIKM